MEKKLYDAASGLPETSLQLEDIASAPIAAKRPAGGVRRKLLLAVSIVLLLTLGFGTYALAAEMKEYSNAVAFFNSHGLSLEGLSREQIKEVYRDITQQSFTYDKTMEVISRYVTVNGIVGYEILQEDPSPEDLEAVWLSVTGSVFCEDRTYYRYHTQYKKQGNHEVVDKSYLEKYEGDTLVWSTYVTDFVIGGYIVTSDGVVIYGREWQFYDLSNGAYNTRTYAWMAKIDQAGNILWKHKLSAAFDDEYVGAMVENPDGSYAVFTRGDMKYFCYYRILPDGTHDYFKRTELSSGIWDAARLGDGYIVKVGSQYEAKVILVDKQGNITKTISYEEENPNYNIGIIDMEAFEGKVYLSGYVVPTLESNPRNGFNAIMQELFENGYYWDVPSEVLTPILRKHYTAVLLVWDPETGEPEEFFSVEGSLGGALSLTESGALLWNVERIIDSLFSPATNSFTFLVSCYVYQYAFEGDGTLIGYQKTGVQTTLRR